jgi:hypothetical protein
MSAILNKRRFVRTVGVSVALLCAACLAEACSVPVFRYALDHWTPDLYRIRIVHDGPLPPEQAEVVQRLRDQTRSRFANAAIEDIDVATSDDSTLKDLWQQSESKNQPLCLIQAPTAVPEEYRDVWSGPLAAETVDSILGSPTREQLVKSLLDGTSVVWIYLESGIKLSDDKHYELLQTELERLQGVIKLPEIDPIDLKELSTSPEDVKLKFETLRLARDNPQEALLVEMLLSTEPDLRDATYVQQPMAFALFGRGRVLYSLVGDGLTPELIEEASRFLTGACQCTVKAQNPGAELLLSVDWDGLIAPSLPSEVDVTLTGLAGFQNDRPAADSSPVVEPAAQLANDPQESQIDDVVEATVTETAVEVESALPTESSATTADTDSHRPSIKRRPAEETPVMSRPVVIVSILAVVIVMASFFLLPRR